MCNYVFAKREIRSASSPQPSRDKIDMAERIRAQRVDDAKAEKAKGDDA